MEQNEETRGNASFGAYLKKVREGRRLSLDAVEELSAGFPEKVTKSHLSRIENGLALPTFPRLMAMGHIYGVPIASLAERYEIELRRGMAPVDLGGKSDEEVLRSFEQLVYGGEFNEALLVVWALLDRTRQNAADGHSEDLQQVLELRLKTIVCLLKLGRYEYAKGQCENILSRARLPEAIRLRALHLFATASFRLQLHTVALLALDECARGAERAGGSGRFLGDVLALRGNLHQASGQPDAAAESYRHAREIYVDVGLEYEVFTVDLNIAVAEIDLGRLDSARTMLENLLPKLEAGRHERLRSLVLSHLCAVHHRGGSLDTAEGFAMKSNAIARPREYHAIVFKNCYYLWEIARSRGEEAAVRLNERTLRSYLPRIEESFPEVDAYRQLAAGDER